MRDPLDVIAEICHAQPPDALERIAQALGFPALPGTPALSLTKWLNAVANDRKNPRYLRDAAGLLLKEMDVVEPRPPGVTAPAADLRARLAPLLNEFGQRQWQSGRGVDHASIEDAFEAVLAAAARGVTHTNDETGGQHK